MGGGTKRTPSTYIVGGVEEPLEPTLGGPNVARLPRRGLDVRSPVVEQLAVQLGWAFQNDQCVDEGGRNAACKRPLTDREIAIAKSVFQRSVDFTPVMVMTTNIMNSPTTLGNVIRINPIDPNSPNKLLRKEPLDDATLVHELTHVWQYQNYGSGYISNSLWRQAVTEGRDGAYELKASQLRSVKSIRDLSVERQARVVELYFISTLIRFGDERDRQRAWKFDASRHLSDRAEHPQWFDDECKNLDRLIGEVRDARPMSFPNMYLESMGVRPNGRDHRAVDPFALPILPLFRIDF